MLKDAFASKRVLASQCAATLRLGHGPGTPFAEEVLAVSLRRRLRGQRESSYACTLLRDPRHCTRDGARSVGVSAWDEWEPLCNLLEVDVPGHPYPRENEGGNWILKMRQRADLRAKAAGYRFGCFALPLAVFGFGFWFAMAKLPLLPKRFGRDTSLGAFFKLFDVRLSSFRHR